MATQFEVPTDLDQVFTDVGSNLTHCTIAFIFYLQ